MSIFFYNQLYFIFVGNTFLKNDHYEKSSSYHPICIYNRAHYEFMQQGSLSGHV